MDVQTLSHRTQAVSRINVTTVLHVVLHAPVQIVLVIVIRILPVSIPEVLQAVDVSTLSTDDISENTVLRHSQGVHLIIVIAAVLQNEAMLACLLAEVYQAPALFQVHCTRHLDGSMLAVLHRHLSHREMVIPVGSDVNQVDVLALAQLLVTLGSAVDVGRLQSLLAEILLRFLSSSLLIITKCNDFYTWNVAETHHRPWSTHSQPHKAHTYCLQLGCLQA